MRLINVRDSNVCNVLSNGRTLFCYRVDVPCYKHSYTFYQTNTIRISRMINWWKNKDTVDGVPHSRPCFFAFPDSKNSEIYWVVPISSKFEKYKRIEQDKIRKYGRCNTICFGTGLGRNTAFLIQNMCPAIEKYLVPYIDKNRQPIRIDDRIAADIKKNAREVLAIARRGSKVIFPGVFQIYRGLEEQLRQAQRDRLPPSSAQEKTSILEQLHQLEQVQPSSNRKKSPKRQDQER